MALELAAPSLSSFQVRVVLFPDSASSCDPSLPPAEGTVPIPTAGVLQGPG